MIPDIHLVRAGLSYRHHIIFNDINLHIPAGSTLALLGASGIGKTSLLRMLAGLTTSAETIQGHIKMSNNINIDTQIAYMAQQDLLLPWLNVLDNVMLPLKLCRHTSKDNRKGETFAENLLERAGLASAKKLFPHQLSGGMRQRTALVRTLIQEKPVILMDEPFSALDTITRYHLQNLALEMLRNKTIIFITHDPIEAIRLADNIYLMEGSPATIKHIASPKSAAPRDIHDDINIKLHAEIFTRLASGEVIT